MSRYIKYLVLLILLSACADDSEISPASGIETNEDPAIDEDIIIDALIDDSDLSILPKDEGGEHMALPLGKTTAYFGHYIYLPEGYSEQGPEYPLLLFLHGSGERADSEANPVHLQKVLTFGPPNMIRLGQWNPSYPFIVVSPQLLPGNYWKPSQIHKFIEYLLRTYQINPSRIYLTGLSLGGGGCWYYAGEIDDHYAAAIVPIAASGNPNLVENLKKVPIWAFHGAKDETVLAFDNYGSQPLVELINAADPLIPAKVTIYPDTGHNSWTKTYSGKGMFEGRFPYDQYNMDIFDWMLQYRRKEP